MRATNNRRKYDAYKIKITYHNGDTEEVEYNSHVDTSNYKEMLEVYRHTKEEYINHKEVAIIDFVGISEQGTIGILFTKEISNYIEPEIIDYMGRDVRDNINEINFLLSVIPKQKQHFEELLGETIKKRDDIFHEIALLDNTSDPNIEHKLIMKAKKNELQRRFAKDNISDINYFNHKLKHEQPRLFQIINNLSEKRDKRGCDKETPEDFIKRVELTVTYKNDIERVRLIKQYKDKYDKMKNDAVKKTLYFYNHVGEGKRKGKINRR